MKNVLVAMMVMMSVCVYGQHVDSVYTHPDQMPEYVGGEKKMMKFIMDNLRYPAIDSDADIKSKVVVKFIVNKDGSISDVQTSRGTCSSLDKEAIRVINMMHFTPGSDNGKLVRVALILPIFVCFK